MAPGPSIADGKEREREKEERPAAAGMPRSDRWGCRDDAGAAARHGAGAPLVGGWGRGGPHLSGPTCQLGAESPVAAVDGRCWPAA